MEKTSSVSVGKLLALRIATQTPLNLIESYHEHSTKNSKLLLNQKNQDFASPYHQFMALARAPLPKADECLQNQMVFEALLEMLVSVGGYPIPSFGSKAMVSLLSLWTRIIDANCFAVEVLWPFPRRKSGLRANTYQQKEGRPPRRQTGLRCGRPTTSRRRLRQIGSAVYGASSYFNHSCDPNLTFAFGSLSQQMCRLLLLSNEEEEGCRKANYDDEYDDSMLATAFEASTITTTTTCTTLMMSARRDVKAGQELCISYGPTFLSHSKTERMKFVSTCTAM